MKTSDKINVTDARLRNALKTEMEYSIVPDINKTISNVANNAKVQIATITKFYPYLDKAEVKAMLEKCQDKVKKLTELRDKKEQEIRIAYKVKYPIENSLEEDLKLFLAEA